jgi:hypothetical protein
MQVHLVPSTQLVAVAVVLGQQLERTLPHQAVARAEPLRVETSTVRVVTELTRYG